MTKMTKMQHYRAELRRAIGRHRRDVMVILVTAFIGCLVGAYILTHQTQFTLPSWVPGAAQHREYTADFQDASGFLPGTSQPVSVQGVEVGVVKDVKLDGRVAAVTMDITDNDLTIYKDATLLVRPRTALKDMFVALDPGTAAAGALPEGGTIPVGQTQPTVDVQDILSNLDADTRSYLRLLLAGGAQGFTDSSTASKDGQPSPSAVADFSQTLRTFKPFTEDARRATDLLAQRRENLKGAISGLSQVMTQLGAINGDISNLVSGANKTFQAVGSQDTHLQSALTELPGTLAELNRALSGSIEFGRQLGISTTALQPLALNLAPAERALQPFAAQTLPVISDKLRPFSRETLPIAKKLKPAVTQFSDATPGISKTLDVFNGFFNALGYNPSGSEEGYLFWGAWLSHNIPSITNIQDAYGPAIRGTAMLTCPQLDALNTVEASNPILGSITKLANLPKKAVVC
jgi:phospholipid/cholesterol/gamma-HCH transport system substrate-binding protein